jgi:hypothetical protein
MDYLRNISKSSEERKKKNHLLNPQNIPVYCTGQTHVPLTHGLLNDKNKIFCRISEI